MKFVVCESGYMAITLKDVASVAGVSTATVSRALAGSERVSPQTADHIKTIASDLGYRFDNVARALRQNRSNLLGLLLPDFAFPYARDLLTALNQELYHSEIVLAAVTSFGSPASEFAQVERLLSQRIDALLILPADPRASAAAINIALAEEIPVLQLFRPLDHPKTLTVELDYAAGIEFALRHLRLQPNTAIVYIDDPGDFTAEQKRAACEAHAQSHHSAECPDLIICATFAAGRHALSQFHARFADTKPPTLICLDALPESAPALEASILSLEFSMNALAQILVEWLLRALKGEVVAPATLRLPPFINLSRFRSVAHTGLH